MSLPERVEATIDRAGLIAAGELVVVAVSGGADSLTLLDILTHLAPERGWRLHVATFDHRWRTDSQAAVAVVRAEAERLGWPCHAAAAPAPERSEAGARRQRLAFLNGLVETLGADRLALAHTADDRAETLLLNLCRGAGRAGLAALPARAGRLIRPLLECSRAEVRAYAAARGLPVVEDPANADPRYARVRLRRDALPLLEAAHPGATAALARAGRLLEAEAAALRRYGQHLLAKRRLPTGGFLAGLPAVVVELAGWAGEPEPERHLLLRAAVAAARGDLTDVDLALIEQLDALAAGPADAGDRRLAGLIASRWRWRLILLAGPAPEPWGPLPVPAGGELVLPTGWRLVVGPAATACPLTATVTLPADATVRSRRPGDRLRPTGRGGSRKVSDLLAELDVPTLARDRVPLLCAGERLLWLPGCPVDEAGGGPTPVGLLPPEVC